MPLVILLVVLFLATLFIYVPVKALYVGTGAIGSTHRIKD